MIQDIKKILEGGNRTSVGRAAEVIDQALTSNEALDAVYNLFFDADPVVVMRSSYVAMRVAEQKPESVLPHKQEILKNLDAYKQQEIRWHIPQLLLHVELTPQERRLAYQELMHWAETDSSKIVAYYSLPTAAKFATEDESLMTDFLPRLRQLSRSEAKSVANRCKKIAKTLKIEL
ncbi:MAG: hypothetical protein EBS38_02795 [Actinobacteria bacterium]|nr:hypothetical protein [Actinomycetota bacterium]